MKTTLEVFNKVSEHLLTQNEKSLGEDEVCAYRNHTGLECAVGCLIDDEFYSEDLEYWNLDRNGIVSDALEKSGVDMTREILDLLQRLQKLHDHTEPETWKEELEKVKIDFFGVKYA